MPICAYHVKMDKLSQCFCHQKAINFAYNMNFSMQMEITALVSENYSIRNPRIPSSVFQLNTYTTLCSCRGSVIVFLIGTSNSMRLAVYLWVLIV